MNEQTTSPSSYPSSSKQRVLEKTLVAVRDRQQKKRSTRRGFAAALAALLLLGLFFSLKYGHEAGTDHSAPQIAISTSRLPTAGKTQQVTQVSILDQTKVKTLTMSHRDIARLVYDPQFKFSEKNGVYTWKGSTKIIHMSMPTTMLAITDSSMD